MEDNKKLPGTDGTPTPGQDNENSDAEKIKL